MGLVVVVVILAALAGGVYWNHVNARHALQGVTFVVPHPPSVVAEAVQRAHRQGAAATLRGMVSGVTLEALGPSAFATSTRLGDRGEISVSKDPAGSLVTARALQLYVGSHPRTHNRAFSAITNGAYRMLGICPGAAGIRRWQNALERRVMKALVRAGA